MKTSLPFSCPICALPLHAADAGAGCENGHRFDRARKGYFNLLPSGRLAGDKVPGDGRELLLARRVFLDSGAFAPLADALCAALTRLLASASAPIVADLGCGEGYYTALIAHALSNACVTGMDISRDAVAMACGRTKDVHWAVANAFHPPLPDGGTDAATVVFAPFAPDALFRILRPGGTALVVVPGAQHLLEIKQVLYDTPYENDETPPDGAPYFLPPDVARVRYTFDADAAQVRTLFSMTPYARRTAPEAADRLYARGAMRVTADFLLLCYTKERS